MTIHLTRPLLERYLRATGWERDAKGFWEMGAMCIGTFDDMNVHHMQHAVGLLAAHERVTMVQMSVKLGALVTAEWCRESTALVKERDMDAHMHMYREIIHAAGIDPAVWEAAR